MSNRENDRFAWNPGDIEWVKGGPSAAKKTTAQKLAEQIQKGKGGAAAGR